MGSFKGHLKSLDGHLGPLKCIVSSLESFRQDNFNSMSFQNELSKNAGMSLKFHIFCHRLYVCLNRFFCSNDNVLILTEQYQCFCSICLEMTWDWKHFLQIIPVKLFIFNKLKVCMLSYLWSYASVASCWFSLETKNAVTLGPGYQKAKIWDVFWWRL